MFSTAYGGYENDGAYCVTEAWDGGYIAVGFTRSFPTSSPIIHPSDLWCLKLRTDGSVEWQKKYGGNHLENALTVQKTSDGYIVAGCTMSYGVGHEDVWVLKLNSDGSVQWQKTYGGYGRDRAYSIQQTLDDGYRCIYHPPE